MRLRSVCATAMSAANSAVMAPTQVTVFRANETLEAFACDPSPSPALRAPSPPVGEREGETAFPAPSPPVGEREVEAAFPAPSPSVGEREVEAAFPAPSPPVGERDGVRGSAVAGFPIATTLAPDGGITGCGAVSINGYTRATRNTPAATIVAA